MQDKTSLGFLEISDTLRQFIEALVEEVVIKGNSFETQKKWLQKHCTAEGIDYPSLESNLLRLFGIGEELKNIESKALEEFMAVTARACYLSEQGTNTILKKVSKMRGPNGGGLKAQWLKSFQEKETATKNAVKVKNNREKAESQLIKIQKELEATQQTADADAQLQTEKELVALSEKINNLKQNEAALKLDIEKTNQRLEKLNQEAIFETETQEKKKTAIAIVVTCLVVAASYLLVFCF